MPGGLYPLEESMQYCRKPQTVDAMRWRGAENCEEVFSWLGWEHPEDELDHSRILVPTPEGTLTAFPGDWITRDGEGVLSVWGGPEFEDTFVPAGGAA